MWRMLQLSCLITCKLANLWQGVCPVATKFNLTRSAVSAEEDEGAWIDGDDDDATPRLPDADIAHMHIRIRFPVATAITTPS